jgi:DNA uptake protein ComE-like DNA-binding protein
MWVAFGLVALALYFAHSMSFELRASDNRASAAEAEQAIEGAARYVSNIIATAQEPASMPDIDTYRSEAVPVGDATFWLIGRGDRQITMDAPYFGLVDEASKLNLNAPWLTVDILLTLPRMTTELAGAILDWRDSNDEVQEGGGAENDTYQRLNPPYRCKNGPFESVDELRLVLGGYLDTLYGEDANLNGLLDPNENDGDVSSPSDNRDGRLDSGLFEYFTVYSREPNLDPSGSNRVSVANPAQSATQLRTVLQNAGVSDAAQVLRQLGNAPVRSVLEFYVRSGMSAEDFAKIETSITITNARYVEGLVNVNTASEPVLACIPGIGIEHASSLVGYRLSNPDKLNTLAWVKDVLETTNAIAAGPYLTGHTWQISADIAAVGHYGRGYQRVKFVFDMSEGPPQVRYRHDLTPLGWALGRQARQSRLAANHIRR